MKDEGPLFLRNLDRMPSQFFTNISREFRTPLTLILGQVESVMSSCTDDQEKQKLLVACTNVRRLLSLINQIGTPQLTEQVLQEVPATGSIIKPSEVIATSHDKAFLEKTMAIIESHGNSPGFTVEILAQEVNMSVSQLNRKLNALIDQPAGQLIRSLRLQKAAELLAKKAGTVSLIAYQLGFNDQAYFSRAFKKQYGCSPTEYMNG